MFLLTLYNKTDRLPASALMKIMDFGYSNKSGHLKLHLLRCTMLMSE